MDDGKNLFPVVEVPDFEEAGDEYDSEYKKSVAWDLEKGDFVQSKSHNLVQSEGIEAYRTWCVKTVATERFSALAYDDDIGAEIDDALDAEDEGSAELALERAIEEALMVNPRTEAVEDFEFNWGTSALHVSFTVIAVEYGEVDVELDLDI